MRLEGKVALVTGGGTGIGAAAAEAFVAEGAKVCITGRRKSVLEEYAAKFPKDKLIACCADVCKMEDVQRMVDTTVAFGGRLDIVVNNAAMECHGSVLDLDPAVWQQMLDTNLTGPFLVSKFAIPHLIKGGGGSIINVASIAGVLALPGMVAYCTTKAGMLGLSRQIAYDYGVNKVRCNTVLPGAVRTDMFEGAMKGISASLGMELEDFLKVWSSPSPLKRVAKPEEFKGLFVYLASDESSYATAGEFYCDAGVHNIDAAAFNARNFVEKLMADRAAAEGK
jgi:NAD(P)-dependent dehydrogenase (short-subunit alcohol dehydrogenase family)